MYMKKKTKTTKQKTTTIMQANEQNLISEYKIHSYLF